MVSKAGRICGMSKPSYRRLDVDERRRQLLERGTEPDPGLPPVEQLQASLEGFLTLVEENAVAYRNLIDSATGVPEIRDLIEEVRLRTAQRILAALYPDEA